MTTTKQDKHGKIAVIFPDEKKTKAMAPKIVKKRKVNRLRHMRRYGDKIEGFYSVLSGQL